jgi:uncharacterized protein
MRRIYDSLHGFIALNSLENALIDTWPFQRLRAIRQLGGTYLVYPGATHTRFEHSLGVMELASRMFDRCLLGGAAPVLPEPAYARQIVRLAALCHDLGHLPLSHVAEKALLGPEGHESKTVAIIESDYLMPIWENVQLAYPGQRVMSDVIKVAIGEKKLRELYADKSPSFSSGDRALCQIIAGDFFGADRIDYLLRDARCTGVSYGYFDYEQLIETVRILPSLANPQELDMGVEQEGIEACEALLVARHFMHRRVYQYSKVKSCSFHLSRFMSALLGDQFRHCGIREYLSWTDHEVLSDLQRASIDPTAAGYEEALYLSDNTQRYRAFSLPPDFNSQVAKDFLHDISLPEEAIAWEFAKSVANDHVFPVLRRSGRIASSSDCLQVVIPTPSIGWVYVAPPFAAQVEQKLLRFT